MDKPVIIIGASSLGKSAMELFTENDVVVYGFLDDDPSLHGTEIGEVAVLGDSDDSSLVSIIGKDCEAFIATEEIELRKNLVDSLVEQNKVMPVNAIHANAFIASSAELGHGNYIGAGTVIGSNAKIGSHLIINTGAIVNDDAELGDFVQVGAGSIVNSGAKVENDVFIGAGVVIISGIKIGKGARIGAGSVVIKDVKDDETVFGNPAEPV
jgi:sugar O-acyltransferase (sialic acid O-acetyltransferase NeuD family)